MLVSYVSHKNLPHFINSVCERLLCLLQAHSQALSQQNPFWFGLEVDRPSTTPDSWDLAYRKLQKKRKRRQYRHPKIILINFWNENCLQYFYGSCVSVFSGTKHLLWLRRFCQTLRIKQSHHRGFPYKEKDFTGLKSLLNVIFIFTLYKT